MFLKPAHRIQLVELRLYHFRSKERLDLDKVRGHGCNHERGHQRRRQEHEFRGGIAEAAHHLAQLHVSAQNIGLETSVSSSSPSSET